MLYTVTSPADSYDRIRLFSNVEAASAVAQGKRPVLGVAVDFDAMMRRVIPTWTDAHAFDPDWTTPAQFHPDGSVMAKGPIPRPLFLS